jgi:hypothetical protein
MSVPDRISPQTPPVNSVVALVVTSTPRTYRQRRARAGNLSDDAVA